jgi:hypothetical protein
MLKAMKETLGWTAKNILVALIPFGIGALIRALSGAQGRRDIFDAGDLCFSMAMLSMLVISSASRLTDKGLRDGITSLFVMSVILFVVLFAFTSFAKTQLEFLNADIVSQLRGSLQSGNKLSVDGFVWRDLDRFSVMLGNVWTWVTIPSVLTVIIALFCKTKYKLED